MRFSCSSLDLVSRAGHQHIVIIIKTFETHGRGMCDGVGTFNEQAKGTNSFNFS